MIFVFTFLGEFGFELLNWQGVIRRFSKTLDPADRIVCCSRAQVYPLYEMAQLYVDISDLILFRRSRACCYSGTVGIGSPARRVNRLLDALMRASVRAHVTRQIRVLRPEWGDVIDRDLTFVFSSRKTGLREFVFGCDPDRIDEEADIYERLDLDANLYQRVAPDLRARLAIERRLGFDLSEPYVLMQRRVRRVGLQSATVTADDLVRALADRVRVVLLSFETGRALDSFSRFDKESGGIRYTARSFPEQACLIHFARHCVFLTEGEFGSHTNVPPFLGKDVTLIAPRGVDEYWRPVIAFWNRHVYRFGGQIRPLIAEEVLASPQTVRAFVESVLDGGAGAGVRRGALRAP